MLQKKKKKRVLQREVDRREVERKGQHKPAVLKVLSSDTGVLCDHFRDLQGQNYIHNSTKRLFVFILILPQGYSGVF